MSLDRVFKSKGVTVVVIACMVILLVVSAILIYNTWFDEYMSNQFAIAEQQDTNIALIHDVIGPTLYLTNPYDFDMNIIKVSIEGIDCNVKTTIHPGMNEVNVAACAYKIMEPAVEVVVYSDRHIYSKYLFIDLYRLPKGAILGGDDCSLLYNIEDDMDGDYYLTGDLNCLDTKNWNNGTGFDPIGNESTAFTGSFRGNGFTIYNLYMNHTAKESGMFGTLDGAVIEDLNFDLLDINGLKKSSGALAGFAKDSTIINVRVKGDITGDKKSVGGIVGELQNSYMSGCSYTNGTITGSEKAVGGIVGLLDNSEVQNSFSTGNVVGNKVSAGGLIGYSKDSLVNDSYSTGTVICTSGVEGGLIGDGIGPVTVDSYWDMDSSGQIVSAGGTGLGTPDMKNPITYTGWDSTVWNIVNGSYPQLR